MAKVNYVWTLSSKFCKNRMASFRGESLEQNNASGALESLQEMKW